MSIFQLPSAALARTVLGTIALIGSLVQPALAQVQPNPQDCPLYTSDAAAEHACFKTRVPPFL